MLRRLVPVLFSLATLLPAAVAFAQKAPPGDIGSSAPEPSLLLMAAVACVPILLLKRRS